MASDDEWVHDADWPLSSAQSDHLIVDNGWVLTNIPNSPPRRNLAGFFLVNNNHHTYIPFVPSNNPSPAANLISTLPTSASIRASAQGIVLARAAWSSYYIHTPASPNWSRLPNPLHSHPISAPTALIADAGKFRVICFVPLPDGPSGFHRIKIFDSLTGKWRIGPDRFPTGKIVPFSGVSCGSAVYFRTETPSVIAYDDAAGVARILPPPPPRHLGEEVKWELAEAKGRILCVCARGKVVEVYQLEEKDRWILLEKLEGIVCGDSPRPLRAQDGGFLVVLWIDGRIGRWDLDGGGAAGMWIGAEAPPPGNCAEYVPYCGEIVGDDSFRNRIREV